MAVIDPADTALLVTRALRKGSTVLAALVAGVAAGFEQAGLVLVIGWGAVLVAHLVVGRRARHRLADRLDREWAAVEPRWSQASGGS